ncbi:MAG: DUF4270 family protein [Bacteroidia bacterium]
MRNYLMNKSRFCYAAIAFFSLLFFSTCKDPDYIEFLEEAPEENFDIDAVDTFTVRSFTVKEDTLSIDEFSADLFGALNDSVFGLTHYSMFFQVELPAVDYDFGANPVATSAVLRLRLNEDGRSVGNTSFPQTLNVYKLNERIFLNRSYVTGRRISHVSDEAGELTTAFNTADSVLNIPLSQSFASSLLPTDPTQYSTNEDFKDFMNGLAVIPDTTGIPSGDGAIVQFLLTSPFSDLILNYTNDSGSHSVVYPVNSSSARISGVSHNYNGTPVADQLAAPQQQFHRVFAQPHGSVKIKLEFPGLKDLVDEYESTNVALMQAQVIIPAITGQGDTLSPPSELLLYGIDQNGRSFVLPDALFTYYGGNYDASENRYQFIITQYLQEEFMKMQSDPAYSSRGVYVIVKSDNPLEANRLIARAKGNSSQPEITLRLTFTKLN